MYSIPHVRTIVVSIHKVFLQAFYSGSILLKCFYFFLFSILLISAIRLICLTFNYAAMFKVVTN